MSQEKFEAQARDLHVVDTYVSTMFKTAHKMFTKHPSSAHWTALSSAMLVHQQWFQIKTMRGGALLSPTLDAMDDLPVSAWGEGIVKSALGMSIAEALA